MHLEQIIHENCALNCDENFMWNDTVETQVKMIIWIFMLFRGNDETDLNSGVSFFVFNFIRIQVILTPQPLSFIGCFSVTKGFWCYSYRLETRSHCSKILFVLLLVIQFLKSFNLLRRIQIPISQLSLLMNRNQLKCFLKTNLDFLHRITKHSHFLFSFTRNDCLIDARFGFISFVGCHWQISLHSLRSSVSTIHFPKPREDFDCDNMDYW